MLATYFYGGTFSSGGSDTYFMEIWSFAGSTWTNLTQLREDANGNRWDHTRFNHMAKA